MNVSDVYGCLYSPRDGLMDPTGWTSSLLKAAKQYGGRYYERAPVQKIELSDNGDVGGRKRFVIY